MLADYIKYFKNSQGAFKGHIKTYTAFEGTVDDPSKRSSANVVTTVSEKLEWLKENSAEYFNALFSQEATNASGTAKAELIVNGVSWGTFSSLELLRFKSILESQDFVNLYTLLPVREDTKDWTLTNREQYINRSVYQDEIVESTNRTTEKENYILPDPNLDKIEGAKYTPQIAQKNTVVPLGKATSQNFSGEITHRERAEMLLRRSSLLTAVIAAIKVANDVESIQSALTADKLFNYLHGQTPSVVKTV